MRVSPAYTGFAEIYDQVMAHVPYEQWTDYVMSLARRHGYQRTGLVADLACGTGSTTLPWARQGFRALGVDRSAPMLAVAVEKAERLGLAHMVQFLEGDLRSFSLPEPVPLAFCLYDSVNYLPTARDLCRMMTCTCRNLVSGGLFIFDVNSEFKLSSVQPGTMLFRRDNYDLIWENEYDGDARIWTVNLVGFVRRSGSLFERFEEVHREHAYSQAELEKCVRKGGLELLAVYGDYTFCPPEQTAERLFFVARKP